MSLSVSSQMWELGQLTIHLQVFSMTLTPVRPNKNACGCHVLDKQSHMTSFFFLPIPYNSDRLLTGLSMTCDIWKVLLIDRPVYLSLNPCSAHFPWSFLKRLKFSD